MHLFKTLVHDSWDIPNNARTHAHLSRCHVGASYRGKASQDATVNTYAKALHYETPRMPLPSYLLNASSIA